LQDAPPARTSPVIVTDVDPCDGTGVSVPAVTPPPVARQLLVPPSGVANTFRPVDGEVKSSVNVMLVRGVEFGFETDSSMVVDAIGVAPGVSGMLASAKDLTRFGGVVALARPAVKPADASQSTLIRNDFNIQLLIPGESKWRFRLRLVQLL
jgi:hypothetical protein